MDSCAQHMWELLQDWWKSIPGEAGWVNAKCVQSCHQDNGYFEESQIKIYILISLRTFGCYMIPYVLFHILMSSLLFYNVEKLLNWVGVSKLLTGTVYTENQLASGDHHLPHAVRHISFGLWNVVPLLLNGYVKLLDIGGKWNTLSYTSIQSIPNRLSGHLVSMQAIDELGPFQLPGIVYRSLWHGAMYYHNETWGDGCRCRARHWASGFCHGVSVPLNCHQ
jgi:hypothetical protein